MAPKILLRVAATLLLATAVVTQFERARADTDPCNEVNQACGAVCTNQEVLTYLPISHRSWSKVQPRFMYGAFRNTYCAVIL